MCHNLEPRSKVTKVKVKGHKGEVRVKGHKVKVQRSWSEVTKVKVKNQNVKVKCHRCQGHGQRSKGHKGQRAQRSKSKVKMSRSIQYLVTYSKWNIGLISLSSAIE